MMRTSDGSLLVADFSKQYNALPEKSQKDFVTRVISHMKGEQGFAVLQHLNKSIKCDVIASLHARGQYATIARIFHQLSVSSLLAVDIVSPIWHTSTLHHDTWKHAIQSRTRESDLWKQILIRLDLFKYIYPLDNKLCIRNRRIGPPDYDLAFNNTESDDDDWLDCSCQTAEFYYKLFDLLRQIVERVTYNWSIGRCVYRVINNHGSMNADINCFQFDYQLIVASKMDHSLCMYDRLSKGMNRLHLVNGAQLHCLEFNDSILCTGGDDAFVRVWCIRRGDPGAEIRAHKKPINSLRLQGQVLVTGSEDGSVSIWDLLSYDNLTWRHTIRSRRNPVHAVDFDASYVLSAGKEGLIYVHNMSTYFLHGTMDARKQAICTMEYRNNIAVTLGEDGLLMIWDVQRLTSIRSMVHRAKCVHFDSTYFVTSTDDWTIHVWKMDSILNQTNIHSDPEPLFCLKEPGWSSCKFQFDPLYIISVDNTIVIRDFFTKLGDLLEPLDKLLKNPNSEARPNGSHKERSQADIITSRFHKRLAKGILGKTR